jgi:adenylate kinase
MTKVIAVFGLSGVGKSWMISRYAAAANVAHIQASQLMRDAIAAQATKSVSSEDLLRGPVLDNQKILTDAFDLARASETRPIIFDGHCLVDSGEQLIEIPLAVIRKLQPSRIVLVHAPTVEIAKRREMDTSRQRPIRTSEALAAQQSRCVILCTEYAERLGIAFDKVRSGDEQSFARSANEVLLT